jgi:hypothetical protein
VSNEIAILEPRRLVPSPEARARAARQIEEYRQRHAALAIVPANAASDGVAEEIAAAVGSVVDSAIGKAAGYATSFQGEAEIEHCAANGSVTRARLKFDYRR